MVSRSAEDACVGFWKSVNGKFRRCHTVSIRQPSSRASLTCRHRLASGALVYATLFDNLARQDTYPTLSRTYSTRNNARPSGGKEQRQIAVLGGGLTGLTTAHYLARHAKDAHITIYEGSNRLGGWIDPQTLTVNHNGGKEDVLLQRGARMVRSWASNNKYDEIVLYDVIANLNLQSQIKTFRPRGPSNNRYVYYPDHLVRMPNGELTWDNIVGSIQNFFTEPAFHGAFRGMLEWNNNKNRPRFVPKVPALVFDQDESLGSFFRRMLGQGDLVKNLLSGMIHGIHGGDINKLSARHTMADKMWYNDMLPPGEGTRYMRSRDIALFTDTHDNPNLPKIQALAYTAANHWDMLAFEDGLYTLVKALEKDLNKHPNVTIHLNAPVSALSHANGQVQVRYKKQTPNMEIGNSLVAHDQVISTLFSKDVARLTQPKNSLPALEETYAVTIMTVNLWYPNPSLLKQNPGFGYLVPQATPNNDECLLGVLFDSELPTKSEVPGTKLTVMLGGHYWDDWDVLPTEEMAISMAREAVSRHLAIDLDEPVEASAKLCRECMPQHYVGHWDRMAKAHQQLLDTFHGQLTVAGPSYTDIGVIPAMRAGYDVAMRVATGGPGPYYSKAGDPDSAWSVSEMDKSYLVDGKTPDHVGSTGLEVFSRVYGTLGDIVRCPVSQELPLKKVAMNSRRREFRSMGKTC